MNTLERPLRVNPMMSGLLGCTVGAILALLAGADEKLNTLVQTRPPQVAPSNCFHAVNAQVRRVNLFKEETTEYCENDGSVVVN